VGWGRYWQKKQSFPSPNSTPEAYYSVRKNNLPNLQDIIIQGNSTFIQNTTGERTETQNVFNFYSDTYANGEWIRDVIDPVIEKIQSTVQ
jgi:hypothetical protein